MKGGVLVVGRGEMVRVLVMSKRLFGRKERECVDEVGEWAMLDGVGAMGWS